MKIRCLILDNLNANGALRMAGTEHELDLAEADIEMLIDCRVIELLNNPVSATGTDPSAPASVPAAAGAAAVAVVGTPEVMLIGSNVQPAEFDLSGTRYTLGELVFEAQRASGLPPDAWNELPDDDREAAIEATRIRIGAERREFVEQAAAAAPTDASMTSTDAGVETTAKPGKKSK